MISFGLLLVMQLAVLEIQVEGLLFPCLKHVERVHYVGDE